MVDDVLTRAVNDVLFTEFGQCPMSQGPGSFQSSNGTEGIAGSTLFLQVQQPHDNWKYHAMLVLPGF